MKTVESIKNFEKIRVLCAEHALGLEVLGATVETESGQELEVKFLTTGRCGTFLRTEFVTQEKNPRHGIIRVFRQGARIEL